MQTKPPYVAIIGAGLGGLCLAQGLRKRGIRFEVFERDPSPYSRTQGYRIRIDRDGRQALRECLSTPLYELFRATSALPVSAVKVLDPELADVADRWVDSWQRSATEQESDADDLNVHRLTLREVLMSGIEEHVHFGKACLRYDERDDGKVVAYFDDGSTATADLLVAADGIQSVVRRQRLPQHEPSDTGSICVYGKADAKRLATAGLAGSLLGSTAIVFGDGVSAIVDAMSFRGWPVDERHGGWRFTKVDDYLYWALIGRRAYFGLTAEQSLELGRDALLASVEAATRSWSPDLRALFEHTEIADMSLLAVRSAAPSLPWQPGPVTVLGDAIHAMSPAGGLGANTALRDAAQLAECLGSAGRGPASLLRSVGTYEAAMQSYSAAAIEASLQGARLLSGHDLAA